MSFFRKIGSLKRIIQSFHFRLAVLEARQGEMQASVEHIQEALGRIEARQLSEHDSVNLQSNEFRVYSQWGEDGIIQFLLRHVPVSSRTFVEFGVEDYTQANTRFLLVNNNWEGLVLDSNIDNIARIRKSALSSYYGLKAVKAFVTKDNINEILLDNGLTGEIGLLSIDIDGNDFWIWHAVNAIDPAIVIIEYNHRFGPAKAVTIPYNETFDRFKSSNPLVYFGASLKALCMLGERKGYDFVGCNSNGVNAFFVRKDKRPDAIRALSAEEGFVTGKFSELRDEQGRIFQSTPEAERQMIFSLPLIQVDDPVLEGVHPAAQKDEDSA